MHGLACAISLSLQSHPGIEYGFARHPFTVRLNARAVCPLNRSALCGLTGYPASVLSRVNLAHNA